MLNLEGMLTKERLSLKRDLRLKFGRRKKIDQYSRTGQVLDSKYLGGERVDTQQFERGYGCTAKIKQ
jgi:hypothetical protein